jgi:hypothetical protein
MNNVQSTIKAIVAAVLLCLSLSFVLMPAASSFAAGSIPILLLGGEFNDAPQSVPACAPLELQFTVKNTGTAVVSSGTLTIEIKPKGANKPAYAKQLPFSLGAHSHQIENITFSPGPYTVSLKATASNKEHGLTREFTLAEQALTVLAPLVVNKHSIAVPRVLIWLGRNGTAVQQAFAEMIVKQAFDENDFYYTVVDTAEDFMNKFMNGDFNTAVLYETNELLERTDWLQDRIARGQGLVIIGPENQGRMIAETFGFTFSEVPASAGSVLLLQEDSGMGLLGTMPISGHYLLPQKKSAKPLALIAADNKPAVLIDKTGNGRVTVLPISLTRSAVDAGTTSLYSLLLRESVRITAPENEEPTGVSSIELLVSTPSGTFKAHLVETLPSGSKVLWTNGMGNVKSNSIVYDLIAGTEPKRLVFLFRPPIGNKTLASTGVYYHCKGKLVTQGKIK